MERQRLLELQGSFQKRPDKNFRALFKRDLTFNRRVGYGAAGIAGLD